MNDEQSNNTNNNGNERLQQIEENLAEAARNIRELTAISLRNEFNLAQYKQANEEWKQQMQEHLSHLTQLVRVFGDKSFEFDRKFEGVRQALEPKV